MSILLLITNMSAIELLKVDSLIVHNEQPSHDVCQDIERPRPVSNEQL